MEHCKVLATHANTLMTLEELKDLIIHNLDIAEFLDILGLTLSDIVDKFDDEIEESFDDLVKAVA
jgi:hypothetical protein